MSFTVVAAGPPDRQGSELKVGRDFPGIRNQRSAAEKITDGPTLVR